MQQLSIAELFEEMGHPYEQLETEVPVDVTELGWEVASFDLTKNEPTWARVTKIVRKRSARSYIVSDVKSHMLEQGFIVAPLHQFWAKIEGSRPHWVEAAALACFEETIELFSPEHGWVQKLVTRGDDDTDVLDLEVEGTNCYFNDGVLSHNTMYGDPWVTPGGKAIPYHASIRIRLTSLSKGKDGDGDIVSVSTNAKCMKTRFGPPFRKTTFDIFFDRGVEDVDSWREMLHKAGEIAKANGMFIMKSVPQQVQVGEDAAKNPVYETQVLPELKFRGGSWKDRLNGDPVFKNHVLDLIEKHMVVRLDEVPWDATKPEPVTSDDGDEEPET